MNTENILTFFITIKHLQFKLSIPHNKMYAIKQNEKSMHWLFAFLYMIKISGKMDKSDTYKGFSSYI